MKPWFGLLALVFGSSICCAQLDTGVGYQPQHTTTLVMGMDVGNGIVPPAPPSRVRVPPGERVVLTLPTPPTTPIQWQKDNTLISGATAQSLVLASATAANSGEYHVKGFPFPYVTTGISLDVVPAGHLANLSSRVELAAGNGVQVVGFVVQGRTPKSILFRAVGPTLKNFGVDAPVRHPRIVCYDAKGQLVGFAHAMVVTDLNALFQSAGAFPVNDEDLMNRAFDYGPLNPGAYTLHVTDADRLGGTVLVEMYEIP